MPDWSLTNPGLIYGDQPMQVDPMTGLAVPAPPKVKFFPNVGARAQQFAQDASQAVQPSISTVEGGFTPEGEQQTVANTPTEPLPRNVPQLFRPKFKDVSEGPYGLPVPVNAGESKLGKLFHLIRAVGEGMAAGSQAGTFGGGFEAAQREPYEDAARKIGAQNAILETQQRQAQMAYLPWQMALARQKAALDVQEATGKAAAAGLIPTRTGQIYNALTRQPIPGVGPTAKEGTPDQQTYDYLQTIPNPDTGKLYTPAEATQAIAQMKQDVKPDPAKLRFQQLAAKFSPEVTPPMMTNLSAYSAGVDRSRLLTPTEKQELKGLIQTQGTPMSQGSLANLRIAGLGETRGTVATDTATGITGPVTWEQINSAPGRYQSPQFGQTGERQKFLQNYENPAGRASLNRQAINNIMQHAGDLADLNQQYRRSNVKIINTPINAIARQFGQQAYTDFVTTTSVLKDELGLYFAGGYAPQGDQIGRWNKILSDEMPPSGVEAFAKEVLHLGLRRATTFNEQFKKNMGYDDPNMIVPEARAAGEKLGLGAEVKKFGSGGQYGPGLLRNENQTTVPQTKPQQNTNGGYAPGFSPD